MSGQQTRGIEHSATSDQNGIEKSLIDKGSISDREEVQNVCCEYMLWAMDEKYISSWKTPSDYDYCITSRDGAEHMLILLNFCPFCGKELPRGGDI